MKEHFSELLERLRRNLILMGGEVERQIQGAIEALVAVDAEKARAVIDRGSGIPRSEREKIFQRFYQIDRSRSKVRPGTGLGLAIVKHIVQLHGGSIEVESTVGQGSVFRVQFPPAAGPARA